MTNANSPDIIEAISDKVHEAWMEAKKAKGITTRKSESGEELMVPYGQLSEAAKDLDRGSVKATIAGIEAAGYSLVSDQQFADSINR